MKTKYDWKKGERGRTLEPQGSKSEQQNVVMMRSAGGLLGEMYRAGHLTGSALLDAEKEFGDLESGGDVAQRARQKLGIEKQFGFNHDFDREENES